MAARAATSMVVTMFVYMAFFMAPIGICYGSTLIGVHFGFGAFRMLVSWLFWFCLQVLMVDPFVVRYRKQLVDLVAHWNTMRSCTRSLLLVYFERNGLYYLLLAATAYAFVLVEAALDLFAGRDVALRTTSALYWTLCALAVLFWMDRLIRQHSHVMTAASSAAPEDVPTAAAAEGKSGEATATLAADGTVSVALRDDPQLSHVSIVLPPSVYLVDEAKHPAVKGTPGKTKSNVNNRGSSSELEHALQTRGHTLMMHGNTAHVGTVQQQQKRKKNGRRPIRALLIAAAIAAIAFPVMQQTSLLQGIYVWVAYAMVGCGAIGAMICMYRDGQRYLDRAYLQFIQLFGTFFPMVVGGWLLSAYQKYTVDNPAAVAWTYGIMLTQLLVSHLFMSVTHMSVSHLAAPFTYARLLFLPQLCLYGFQYFVFGLTAWSPTYVVLVVLANLHNLLSSTSAYSRLYDMCCANRRTMQATQKPLFGSLLATAHAMELFGQDVLADLMSFLTVTALAALDAVLGSRTRTFVLPQFPSDHLWQRASLAIGLRVVSWLCARRLFRSSLTQLTEHAYGVAKGTTMRALLDKYLATLHLPRYKAHAMIQVYEHAVPEMLGNFTIAGDTLAGGPVVTASGLISDRIGRGRRRVVDSIMDRHAGKSIASYVLYWRSLVHPSILKKHSIYFMCCFLLILFVVLQAPNSELPMRYAWYRPASSSPDTLLSPNATMSILE